MQAKSLESMLDNLTKLFTVEPATFQKLQKHFITEAKKGLEEHGAGLPMIPTYIQNRVTGDEPGEFLALDLNAENIRICRIILRGEGKIHSESETFSIPLELKKQHVDELFEWVVVCVELFFINRSLPFASKGKHRSPIPLGFAFSFSCEQTAINHGTLITWSKGFSCPGLVGTDTDVVELLQKCFNERQHNIMVSALVNDTSGTLLACSYGDPSCSIAVILGSGSNAAYYEKRENIKKWRGQDNFEEMIINTEWAAFDNCGEVLPVTTYDRQLELRTTDRPNALFEKMIGAMYLGELARLVLADLTASGVIFREVASFANKAFLKPEIFTTEDLSVIVGDSTNDLSGVRSIMSSILFPASSKLLARTDLEAVRKICSLIGTRAAQFSGVGIVGILSMRPDFLEGNQTTTIAVDGSLFQSYPGWEDIMKSTLQIMLGDANAKKVRFKLAKDGSGVGGAITAMLAAKQLVDRRGSSSSVYSNLSL